MDRPVGRRALSDLNRVVCAVVGLALGTFGVLGFVGQLAFFSTAGAPVAGMSTNGLLSTLSVVFAVVLLGAAVRGGRTAATVAAVVGVLFFLSGIANVLVVNTGLNILAFRMSNVVFSLVVGAVLAICGIYGRMSLTAAGRGDDEPGVADLDPRAPVDTDDVDATRDLAEAERAVAAGAGTPYQREIVAEVADLRDSRDRRDASRRHRRAG